MKNETKLMINELITRAANRNIKATDKIRPIKETGTGKHAKYSVDHTAEYCSYLKSLNLKYEIGNDSPRGGQLGKYIQVKIDKRNTFIKSLIK